MAKGKLEVLERLNKVYTDTPIKRIKDMSNMNLRRDTTGSLEIDHITGGGFIRGRIIELIGPNSSGKTTLALQAMGLKQKAEAIEAKAEKRPERAVAVIDMEHALDSSWAQTLGVDTEELVITQPNNGEAALQIAMELINSGEFCMIIIDSIAALKTKSEIEGEIGDHAVGKQAKMMSQACPKISIAANKNDCTVIFMNQIRMKIGVSFGSPETTPGGEAMKFYASMRVDIRNIGAAKGPGDERIGNSTKVKCLKNKGSKPFGVCTTRLTYGVGFDYIWEVFNIAIQAKIVTKGGSWYAFGESKLGQGEANVVNHLRQDPDTFEAIEYLVKQAITPQTETEEDVQS